MKKYSVVSLFSGAGGLDLGLDKEGFETIWANDFDYDSCETYKLWSKAKVVCEDISKLDFNKVPQSDIVVGGFPCQGFSLAGPRKIDDARNKLYHYFVKMVDEKKPKAFIAENVKGILTLGGGKIVEAIISDFASKGYKVKYQLHNAADFGVPQDRKRVLFVGIRDDIDAKFDFPQPLETRTSLREILEVFTNPKLEDICDAPYSSRYMSRNRRKSWDDVSFTIPAMAKQVPLHPESPEMIKIHKDLWQFGNGSTRRFSWQEAAAVQTFPRDMHFTGNLISKYKQIGNAVPVGLARHIGKSLYQALEKN